MAYENLIGLFGTHLVELAALRKHPKKDYGAIRVFLATNSRPLLNSIAGKTALGFRTPTNPPPYNAKAHNLFITYDLWMQGWRAINLNDYIIKAILPLKTQNDIQDFWGYYSYILKPMSASEKIAVLDNRGYRNFTIDSIQEYMKKQREESEKILQYEHLLGN